jgi:hypothetical protein
VVSGVVEITLDTTDNTMVDPNQEVERRRVTAVGLYGADDKITAEYKYRLNNLAKAPLAAP